ncbi:MAG: N-acetylornithine carbamoyltransferase [Bacteroidota bacterium]
MLHFTKLADIANPQQLLQQALEIKQYPFEKPDLGKNKTLGLVFFNSSLRTRLSSQRAAQNLGLHTIVMNVSADAWQLEFEDGTVMNAGKAEHIREAAPVMAQYCDILGIRAFAGLSDREADYREEILTAFQQFSGVPVISLESATRHPLQSLADWVTIETNKKTERPKVVLTWAPHPRALPQAVGNSFAEWMQVADVDLTITHPPGYELDEVFSAGATIEYDPYKAYAGADFVYAKNWSSFQSYGQVLSQDARWMVDAEKMALTNEAFFMHCLPVRRNVVVADAVIDSPKSLVIEQAGNRTVSAQAVMQAILTH